MTDEQLTDEERALLVEYPWPRSAVDLALAKLLRIHDRLKARVTEATLLLQRWERVHSHAGCCKVFLSRPPERPEVLQLSAPPLPDDPTVMIADFPGDPVASLDEIRHPDRAAEKQASRDEDERRLAAGEVTREELARENSWLPVDKARIDYSKVPKGKP